MSAVTQANRPKLEHKFVRASCSEETNTPQTPKQNLFVAPKYISGRVSRDVVSGVEGGRDAFMPSLLHSMMKCTL